ncbi:hypothetical protein HY629_00685 [Candidatus Uhrbacteria bacterium]|nr:hypothetical protein [Candidatus Uhrbacteria bacterium]
MPRETISPQQFDLTASFTELQGLSKKERDALFDQLAKAADTEGRVEAPKQFGALAKELKALSPTERSARLEQVKTMLNTWKADAPRQEARRLGVSPRTRELQERLKRKDDEDLNSLRDDLKG